MKYGRRDIHGIIIDSLNDSKLHSALAAGGVPVAIQSEYLRLSGIVSESINLNIVLVLSWAL